MHYFIELYHRIFNKCSLQEVFTPSTIANVNYLRRNDLEQRIARSLDTPGVQIILYGHSGSGKTTVIRKLLDEKKYSFVRTQCSTDKTLNDIILDAFSQLDSFCVSEKTFKKGRKVGASLKNEIQSIKAEINSVNEESIEQKLTRLLPTRLTPQKLAEIFRKAGKIWMLEDFHKLCNEEKQKLADVMKIFVDEANDIDDSIQPSKIICIGAVSTPRELIALDPNLSSRVDQIKVPLLKDEEIKEIIEQGCHLLNVVMSNNLVQNLVSYSNNIGSLAHFMCLDICYDLGVEKTSFNKVIVKDKSFDVAIKGYLDRNSDTLQKSYDLITAKNKAAWYILKTMNIFNKDSITYKELINRINPKCILLSEDEINQALTELQGQPYYIIRYDEDRNSYSFSTPFWSAFIRIQLESEQAERNKKKSKIHKHALILNQDSFEAMTFRQLLDLYEEQFKIMMTTRNNK